MIRFKFENLEMLKSWFDCIETMNAEVEIIISRAWEEGKSYYYMVIKIP